MTQQPVVPATHQLVHRPLISVLALQHEQFVKNMIGGVGHSSLLISLVVRGGLSVQESAPMDNAENHGASSSTGVTIE
jgi:hypothetical protein